MLPLIIMAAASILSNSQKQEEERKQVYLDALQHKARVAGGDPYMAEQIGKEHQIDMQGADYGPLLKLVGSAADSPDTDPNKVFGSTSYAHDSGGVQYDDPVDLGDPYDKWKSRRGF